MRGLEAHATRISSQPRSRLSVPLRLTQEPRCSETVWSVSVTVTDGRGR
jgi:hypothetical protein